MKDEKEVVNKDEDSDEEEEGDDEVEDDDKNNEEDEGDDEDKDDYKDVEKDMKMIMMTKMRKRRMEEGADVTRWTRMRMKTQG
jgi:hypothetical protein